MGDEQYLPMGKTLQQAQDEAYNDALAKGAMSRSFDGPGQYQTVGGVMYTFNNQNQYNNYLNLQRIDNAHHAEDLARYHWQTQYNSDQGYNLAALQAGHTVDDGQQVVSGGAVSAWQPALNSQAREAQFYQKNPSLSPGAYGGSQLIVQNGKAGANNEQLLKNLQGGTFTPLYQRDDTARQLGLGWQNNSLPTTEQRDVYSARIGSANYQNKDQNIFKVSYQFTTDNADNRTTGRPNSNPSTGMGSTPLSEAFTEKGASAFFGRIGEDLISGIRGFNKAQTYTLTGVDSVPREYVWNLLQKKETKAPSYFFTPWADKDIQSFGVGGGVAASVALFPIAAPYIEGGFASLGTYQLVKNPTVEQAADTSLMTLPMLPRAVNAGRDAYVWASAKGNYVPLSDVTTADVITGKATFPKANSAEESLSAFNADRNPQTGGIRVTTATNAILYDKSGVPFTGEFIGLRGGNPAKVDALGNFVRDSGGKIKIDTDLATARGGTSGTLARETEGLYVTPASQTSIYFTRLGKNVPTEYSMFPTMKGLFSAPKIVQTEAIGVERVPMGIIEQEGRSFALSNQYILDQKGTGKAFLTPRSEKGFIGGYGRQTTEIEAVFPAGTEFEKVGTIGYTKIGGRNVPIIEYKVLRESSGDTVITRDEFSQLSDNAAQETVSSIHSGKSQSFSSQILGGSASVSTIYGARNLVGGSSVTAPSGNYGGSGVSGSIISLGKSQIFPLPSSRIAGSTIAVPSYGESTPSTTLRSSSNLVTIPTDTTRLYSTDEGRYTAMSTGTPLTKVFGGSYDLQWQPARKKHRRESSFLPKNFFVLPQSGAGNQFITGLFSDKVSSPGRERLGEFKRSRMMGTDFFQTKQARTKAGRIAFNNFGVRVW